MDNVGTPILMPVDLVGEAQDMGFDVAKSCKVDLQRRINIVKDNSPTFRMDHSSNSNLNWAQNSSSSYRNGKRTTIEKDPSELIADFEDFCEVDLDLADATVYKHKLNIRNFLEWNDSLEDLSKQEVRNYLKERKENEAKATYSNRIKTLRRFFRDFLDEPQLIEGFKLTTPSQNNCNIPDKKDLQEFYKHISNEKYRAIFLFLATSGLRTGEVTGLEMDDVDFDKRKVIPNHESTTKRSYVTFYNDETEEALNKYLPKRKDGDSRIFQVSSNPLQKSFRKTSERSGVKITPKTLRKWFAKEMRNLGVSGEHIDAFAGRLPQSVRAKHYTSYSPERLKEIYTRADIKVLN